MSKWIKFHTSHSPVNISVNQGASNVLADWRRLDWTQTYLDGKPLEEIMKDRKMEKENLSLDNLIDFFSEVVLSNYDGKSKEKEVKTLLETFHQGGLLHPVSAGLVLALESSHMGPSANDSPKRVNIQTTKNGFVLQEICTVKKCRLALNAPDELVDKYPDYFIEPDDGHDFVFQAEATIDISFNNDGDLKTTVLEQAISYGNEEVKKIADKRGWFQKLIDYFKNKLGWNIVKDLSQVENDQSNVMDNQRMQP